MKRILLALLFFCALPAWAADPVQESEVHLKAAIAKQERDGRANQPSYAWNLNSLAQLYTAEKRYDEAEPLYKKALEIITASLGPAHPGAAIVKNNLGALYFKTKRYDLAEPLFVDYLTSTRDTFGGDSIEAAQALSNLSVLFLEQKRYGEAYPLLQQALSAHESAVQRQTPGSSLAAVSASMDNLVRFYRENKRWEEAVDLWGKAIYAKEKVLGWDAPELAKDTFDLAQLCRRLGRHTAALTYYQKSLGAYNSIRGSDHPLSGVIMNNIGLTLVALKKPKKAERFYKDALAIMEKRFGPKKRQTLMVAQNYVDLLVSLGKKREAKALVDRMKGGG